MTIVKRELTYPGPAFLFSASHVSALCLSHLGCVASTALPSAWATPTTCPLALPHPSVLRAQGPWSPLTALPLTAVHLDTQLTPPTPFPFLTRATATPSRWGRELWRPHRWCSSRTCTPGIQQLVPSTCSDAAFSH